MQVLAACHVHSNWSYDGSWTLGALRDKFVHDHRVILMTEHDRGFTQDRFDQYRSACSAASTPSLLLIPGIEYSDAENRTHVLVWGTPFLGEGLPTSEMLNLVRNANGVAVFAHPSRRNAFQHFDDEWTRTLLGVEAWNRKYDGWAPSKASPELQRKTQLLSFVGLDFHTERQSFPLAMALDVNGSVTEGSVLDCLRSRRCIPQAFGIPLGEQRLRVIIPALGIAESTRRRAISILKQSKLLTR